MPPFTFLDIIKSQEKKLYLDTIIENIRFECLSHDKYQYKETTIAFTFFGLKLNVEIPTDLSEFYSQNDEVVQMFFDKYNLLSQSNQVHETIEFSLYIENEKITPSLIVPLFSVIKAATKVTLKNCTLIVDKKKDYSKLINKVRSYTICLLLDQCELYSFQSKYNKNFSLYDIKLLSAIGEEAQELLQKLLTQTQLTDSIREIEVFDPDLKLKLKDSSFTSTSLKNEVVIKINNFDSIAKANQQMEKCVEEAKNKIKRKAIRESCKESKVESIIKLTSPSNNICANSKTNNHRACENRPFNYEKKARISEAAQDIRFDNSKNEDLYKLFLPMIFNIYIKVESSKLQDLEIKCINNEDPNAEVDDIDPLNYVQSNITYYINTFCLSFVKSKNDQELEAIQNVNEDKCVLYISFSKKIIKLRCDEINCLLNYLEIFQHSYLSNGMTLYLINTCCCKSFTMRSLNSILLRFYEQNCFLLINIIRINENHECKGLDDDCIDFNPEFTRTIKQYNSVISNSLSPQRENMESRNNQTLSLYKINEYQESQEIKPNLKVNSVSHIGDKCEDQICNNLHKDLKSYISAQNECSKLPGFKINLTLSAKINLKGEVTYTYSEINNYNQKVKLDLTQVKKLKTDRSSNAELISINECSTIILKDDLAFAYSSSNKNMLISSEEGQFEKTKIRYFANQYERLKYLNPNVGILLFHLPCCVNMLKINAKTWYIDLRNSTYTQALFCDYQQKIEILILNVDKIYGFNKCKENVGIFDPVQEFGDDSDICPSTASIVKFLVQCKSIDSLKFLLINKDAVLNKSLLESMISELRKEQSEITIKYFKSDSKDNDEEDKDNNRSDSEFKFDKASKDYYDKFYQQSIEISKDEDLRHSYHTNNNNFDQHPLLNEKTKTDVIEVYCRKLIKGGNTEESGVIIKMQGMSYKENGDDNHTNPSSHSPKQPNLNPSKASNKENLAFKGYLFEENDNSIQEGKIEHPLESESDLESSLSSAHESSDTNLEDS